MTCIGAPPLVGFKDRKRLIIFDCDLPGTLMTHNRIVAAYTQMANPQLSGACGQGIAQAIVVAILHIDDSKALGSKARGPINIDIVAFLGNFPQGAAQVAILPILDATRRIGRRVEQIERGSTSEGGGCTHAATPRY